MPSSRLALLAACTLAGGALFAGTTSNTSVLKFSDSTKPGTVKVHLGRGDLDVVGADTAEVSVKSEATANTGKPRQDGLRVISAAAGFAFKESENVITLDATSSQHGHSRASFQLTVPRDVTLIVQNAWGGDIHCRGVAGDIEINSMHGEIRLEDISGGAVVGTMNGEIHAGIRALQEGRPLSFTSMNGEVVLRVPADAKASVRLRTQNGSVLTDFDEAALVTRTEAVSGFSRPRTFSPAMGGKILTAEVQDAIREATQLSATAIREALEAVREGLEASRLDSDAARRSIDLARRELERSRQQRQSQQQTADATAEAAPPAAPAKPAPPASPRQPMPPKVPIPTLTGGKLVSGTLNGGGPEISVATMNGDVILRKLEASR